MTLINKATLNFVLNQNENTAKSILCYKPYKNINLNELRYVPQNTATDTVEISQKEKIFKTLLNNLSEIATMRQSGVSQEALAKRFGTNRYMISDFLTQYLPNVNSDEVVFRKALQKFMSARTEKERNTTFKEVDKILQKIAEQKVNPQNKTAYQDCLQDIRLTLLESVKQKEGTNRIVYTEILQKLKDEKTPVSKEPFIESTNDFDIIPVNDPKTLTFEKTDLLKYLINYSNLSERERLIIYSHLIEGKTLKEIGNNLWLTAFRIQQILKTITEKMNAQYRRVSSEKYLTKKVNSALETTNKILKEENDIK